MNRHIARFSPTSASVAECFIQKQKQAVPFLGRSFLLLPRTQRDAAVVVHGCRGEGVPWTQAIDSRVLRVISVADVARRWESYILIKNKNFCFTR